MKKILTFLFLLSSISLLAQKIGSWEDHLPYHNVVSVTHSQDKIYASAKAGIFSYSLEDFSLEKLSKADGLSDISNWSEDNHQLIAYHPDLELLLVAYTNGNIDLVKDNEIINIPFIKNASVIGVKRIYSIDFIGNFAYLSSSLGVLVIDLENYQVKDTYTIGETGTGNTVYDFTEHNDTFFAATERGLFKAPSDGSVNLLNFRSWEKESEQNLSSNSVDFTFAFNDQLYVIQSDSIFRRENQDWQLFYHKPEWSPINYSIGYNKILITQGKYGQDDFVPESANVISLDANGTATIRVPGDDLTVPYQAIEYEENNYWVAEFYRGLYIYGPNNNVGFIHPNGPQSDRVFAMDYGNDALHVASGGVTNSFNFNFVRDGFFILKDNFWNSYNQFLYPLLESYLDMIDVEVNDKTGVAYFASYYGGVVKYEPGGVSAINKDNSALQAPSGDPNRTTAAAVKLDRNDNLWVANNNVSQPLVVITPDGDSYAYSFPANTIAATDIVIDDFGQKWVICQRESDVGMVVYDDNGTLDNTSDDRSILVNRGSNNGNLHTTQVNCAAKDQEGAIWVGTEEGVAVFFCPGSILESGCSASRPLVEQDGNLNYLLETEVINDIEVDGANRKWFATNNGAFLMNEDGDEQITYFNESNSPLLSNVVRDITIDHKSGTVFFGTDNGIIEYVGTAANNQNPEEECMIYPNPVRPGYEGLITIDGVVPNSEVKITDASGTLFYETTALGSRITWDGKNYNGQRASTGVYLVFISNEDGTETNVCKLLIVN